MKCYCDRETVVVLFNFDFVSVLCEPTKHAQRERKYKMRVWGLRTRNVVKLRTGMPQNFPRQYSYRP